MSNCKITLAPLKSDTERARGYSNQGLKHLAGRTGASPRLPFDRTAFEVKLPKRTKGMSISGFQPKLQLVLNDNEFNVIDSAGSYILKPSPKEFPHLAENEHATMMVMQRLGFEVPPHGLLEFAPTEGEPCELTFVIKRYDRDDAGQPIHQVQMDGSMDVGEKFGKINDDGLQYVSYEKVGKFLAERVDSSMAARIDFFQRIVLAYLLGNNDAHLRNFGILHSERDRIAPIYDYVSVAPYPEYFASGYMALPLLEIEEGDGELAPGFSTEYGQYMGADFILLGEGIGLKPALTKVVITKLASQRSIVEQTYRASFMPEVHIEAVLACFNNRLKMLQVFEAEAIG